MHNETFNKFGRFKNWQLMYEKMIKAIKLME